MLLIGCKSVTLNGVSCTDDAQGARRDPQKGYPYHQGA